VQQTAQDALIPQRDRDWAVGWLLNVCDIEPFFLITGANDSFFKYRRKLTSGLDIERLNSSARNGAISSDTSYSTVTGNESAAKLEYGNATLAGLPTNLLTVYSLYSMPQHGQSPVSVARLTLKTLLPVFTDYVSPSELSSNWRLSFTGHSTALSLVTCPHAETRCWHSVSCCSLRSSTTSQLVVRPSRLATVGECSFALAGPRLWNNLPGDLLLRSDENRKHICFGSHIQTLFCSLLTVLAMVVLAVTFYLGPRPP